jgi:hypothetical protein
MVPPQYRSLVRTVITPGVVYTLILFRHDRGDVVTSGPVKRALMQLEQEEQALAVGANFTAEAIGLLQSRGAAIARLGEFYWTDDSYLTLP